MNNIETIEDVEVIDKTAEARNFDLIFLNDDTTPFEFVIFLLVSVINKSPEDAIKLTYKVHEEGATSVKSGTENEMTALQNEIKLLVLDEGFEFKTIVEEQI